MKFTKILASFLLVFYLFGFVLVPKANAQVNASTFFRFLRTGDWYDQGPIHWFERVYGGGNPQEIFGERYTAAQVQWIIYSIPSVWLNLFIDPEVTICLMNAVSAAFGMIPGVSSQANLGTCADVIAVDSSQESNLASQNVLDKYNGNFLAYYFSVNPNSGIKYVYDKANNLNLVPEASAQGFGYQSLYNSGTSFVSLMWQASRDISYALFVLMIIAVAFMIMFRVKIAPQVVITIQSALPKVIISLILVVFSFAIAGLMIDVVYVLIGFIATIFLSSGIFAGGTTWATLFNYTTNGPGNLGIVGILGQFFILGFIGFLDAGIQMVKMVTEAGGNAGGALGTIGSGALGLIAMIVATPIFWLFFILMIIFQSLRIIWFMIRNYISIILLIIFSPFFIALGVVNIGKDGIGFGQWFRTMVSYLAVYPVMAAMILLMFAFIGSALSPEGKRLVDALGGATPFQYNAAAAGSAWGPPLTLGSNATGALLYLVGLVIFFILPAVGRAIRQFMAGKPFDVGGEASALAGGAAGYALARAGSGKMGYGNIGSAVGRIPVVGQYIAPYTTRAGLGVESIARGIHDQGVNKKVFDAYGKSPSNWPERKNSTGAVHTTGEGPAESKPTIFVKDPIKKS